MYNNRFGINMCSNIQSSIYYCYWENGNGYLNKNDCLIVTKPKNYSQTIQYNLSIQLFKVSNARYWII